MTEGVKLASGYVELTIQRDKAIKQVSDEITGLERQSRDTSTRMSRNLSDGFGNVARDARRHGSNASGEFRRGFGQGIRDAVDDGLAQFGRFGTGASNILNKMSGPSLIAATGVAGIAAAGAATLTQLYKLGSEWDSITDSMVIATGKVGPELDKLINSVKNVGIDTAAPLAEIGDISTRLVQTLKLQGKPLEQLTKQIADLQAMTGDSINIRDLSKLVHGFNIEAGDTDDVINTLYDTFTQTGIPVSELITILKDAGPALRGFHMELGPAANLLVTLEEAGVNGDKALGSMRIALGKLSTELNKTEPSKSPLGDFLKDQRGKPMEEVLANVIAQISTLNQQGQTVAANDLGKSVFGKSWTDIGDAIKGDKLHVEDLQRSVANTGNTVEEARGKTEDWSEEFEKLKNRLEIGLEPAANRVFGGINGFLTDTTASAETARTSVEFIARALTPMSGTIDLLMGKGNVWEALFSMAFPGSAAALWLIEKLMGGGGGPLPDTPGGIPAISNTPGQQSPIVPGVTGSGSVPGSYVPGQNPLLAGPSAAGLGNRAGGARGGPTVGGGQGLPGQNMGSLLDSLTGGGAASSATGGTSSRSASIPNTQGLGPRAFAHQNMLPYWQSRGFNVGDHAADYAGEHQNGALDIFVPSIEAGNAILGQILADPNAYGVIFNNMSYGYGGSKTSPRKYTGSSPHTDHIHVWYKPQGMQLGGQLPGFGGGDRIPLLAEGGEFIVNKDATREWLPLLHGINDGAPGFRTGGFVKLGSSGGSGFLPGPGGGGSDEQDRKIQRTKEPIWQKIPKPGIQQGEGWYPRGQWDDVGTFAPWWFWPGDDHEQRGGIFGIDPNSPDWDRRRDLNQGPYDPRLDPRPRLRRPAPQPGAQWPQGLPEWPLGFETGGMVPGLGDYLFGQYGENRSDVPDLMRQWTRAAGAYADPLTGRKRGDRGGVSFNRGDSPAGRFHPGLQIDTSTTSTQGGWPYSRMSWNMKDLRNVIIQKPTDVFNPVQRKRTQMRLNDPMWQFFSNGIEFGSSFFSHGGLVPGFADGGLVDPALLALAQAGMGKTKERMLPGAGRTEGYIPAAAGGSGQAGSSFASGLYMMGADAVKFAIDQAAGAGAGAANMFAPGAGAAVGIGAEVAKKGVDFGFQMAGIWTDAAAEIFMPFGVPRFFQTDPMQFVPQWSAQQTATTTGEKGQLHQGTGAPPGPDLNPGGPVQPGQLPGRQPVGASVKPASGGGVPSVASAIIGAGQPNNSPASFAAKGFNAVSSGNLKGPGSPAAKGFTAAQQQQKPKSGVGAGINPLSLFGFDNGGLLEPDMIGINKTNEPEPVLAGHQWSNLEQIANMPAAQYDPTSSGSGYNDYRVILENVTVKDIDELQRTMTDRQKLQMMRHSGRPSMGGR